MFPFIDLGFIKIPTYGLCMLLGIASSVFTAIKLINDKNKLPDFIIVATLSLCFGLVGTKILYILISYPIKNFFIIIRQMLFTKNNDLLKAGFVFYGAIIFAPAGYFIGCKIARCKPGSFLAESITVIPLGHAIGRIGCFFAGCCYGIPYEGIFTVKYHAPLSSVKPETGIFPIQLLEALLLILLFILLLILYKKNKPITPIYITGYSIIRFCTEFLRGDSERGSFIIFSTSQWISIAAFFAGIITLIILSIKKHTQPV